MMNPKPDRDAYKRQGWMIEDAPSTAEYVAQLGDQVNRLSHEKPWESETPGEALQYIAELETALAKETGDHGATMAALARHERYEHHNVELQAQVQKLRAALEATGSAHHDLSDEPEHQGTLFIRKPGHEGLRECSNYICAEARATLTEERR